MVAQIVGKYRLLQALGRGATAQVYLGEHVHLHTYAALKVLHTQGNLSTAERQGFVAEAQIIAQLQHQHIVRVLDFDFSDQGVPFLVMEYAAHGSLRQLHPPGERLQLLTIVDYLEQVGAALMYVHQAGVVHADVKPENMLLGNAHRLLLGDFGIATFSSRSTTGLICGTPAYMAPEQVQRHPCAASDQYSLAIVVYEWLCGQVPFQGKTLPEVLAQQVQNAVPPLCQLVPGLVPEIEQVVQRALAKDPATRFPDVATFVSAFSQAVHAPTRLSALPPTQPVTYAMLSAQPTLLPAHQQAQPAASTSTAAQPAQPIAPVPGDAQAVAAQLAASVPVSRKQGETLYALDLEAGAVRALAWSPDGNTLAAGCAYQEIFLWDALTGEHKRAHHLHEHQIRGLAWSPRGRILASACADQLIHLWGTDESSPQPHLTYRGHAGNFTLGLACVVAWSPSSLLLASAGTDRTAQVWRASDGTLLCTCRGHSDDINAICWSPDGTQLATGSDDGSVRLWDALSGDERAVWRHQRRQVYALAWSLDGTQLASSGEDNNVYIWQVHERTQPCYTIYQGHTRSVYALAWSPAGTQLVSAGRDHTAQIWRTGDGIHLSTYTGHASSVLAAAWSPDEIGRASCWGRV